MRLNTIFSPLSIYTAISAIQKTSLSLQNSTLNNPVVSEHPFFASVPALFWKNASMSRFCNLVLPVSSTAVDSKQHPLCFSLKSFFWNIGTRALAYAKDISNPSFIF